MKKRQPSIVRGIAPGIILGIVLLGGSCTEKAPEAPTPATPAGPSITGQIQPAGAVLGVSLLDTTTHQTVFGTDPNSQGAYRFGAVPAGTYELSFYQRRGYVRPRQQRVTVTAGKTTAVPAVAVVQSTGSVTANGVALPPPFLDLLLNASPGLFALVLGDDLSGGAGGTYRLHLHLPVAVRVGTYALNGVPAYATFHEFNAAVFDSRPPAAPVPSGGTVTVTAVENTAPFPRFVSGTFRFTGTDPARGTQKTVSGTFDNASF